MLSHKRDVKSAKRFFKKDLKHCHEVPLKFNTDKNPAYPQAIRELKEKGDLPKNLIHRQVKYLNNRIESDHRRIKQRIRPMLGFKSFKTANSCLKGIEAMTMMIKQQPSFLKLTIRQQVIFIHNLFGLYS